jgi:hypothetical protein
VLLAVDENLAERSALVGAWKKDKRFSNVPQLALLPPR